MIDLSALTQAQNWNKKYPLIGSQGDAKDSEMMDVVVAAVDAVLEADQIDWCQTHESAAFGVAQQCRRYVDNKAWGYEGTQCVLVSVVVVPVETPQ